jgi:uncharacterized Rmd1/YagE family protein
MITTLFSGKTHVKARAFFMGERIDTKSLSTNLRLALTPTVIAAGTTGLAVVFRYGVAVAFDLTESEEAEFLVSLRELVTEPHEKIEREEMDLIIARDKEERVLNGGIYIQEISLERIQMIASILSKSVVLGHYESQVAGTFDRIEPMARNMQSVGRGFVDRDLIRHIGSGLLIEHKMVGRVEILEKPEVLWERPELERLYLRLEDEYELRERHLALERKLSLVSRTVETMHDLLSTDRALRVEWYIVILIVIELIISLYTLFFKG